MVCTEPGTPVTVGGGVAAAIAAFTELVISETEDATKAELFDGGA